MSVDDPHNIQEVLANFLPVLRGDPIDNYDEVLSLFDENIVASDWSYPGEEIKGKEAFVKKYLNPDAEPFKNATHIIHDVIVSKDKFVICALFKGLFVDEYLGFTPHGGEVSWTIRDVYEVKSGKICAVYLGLNSREQLEALSSNN